MPTAQYSSFDRGFDVGHAAVPDKRAPVIERRLASKGPSHPWRKYAAIAMVAIMVASAFVMLVPMAKQQTAAPGLETPAHAQAPGDREVTYTLSHIGESYLKDSSLSAMGRHGSTPGVSEWWTMRQANYGDTVIHNAFPYGIGYNPNSAYNAYKRINYAGYIMVSFARFEMDAKNVTTVATGPEQDPKIIPILHGGPNPDQDDGGTVVFNWFMTYLTSADVAAIQAGSHYANTYYGVTPAGVNFGGSYANDGWYFEHQGTLQFDRSGAHKFLNLPATGDLRTEFNTANSAGAVNDSFAAHYDNEGNAGAIYDTYACYDFATDPVEYFLMVDPTSTADSLVLRMWGYSWGIDALMLRYMEVTGLMDKFNVWPEDWCLNGTITSTGANIQSRMVTFDHMTNWKDYSVYTGAWIMEPTQADWTYSDPAPPGWVSRYNDYDAYALTYRPGKEMWAPGSNYYGTLDTHTGANTVQGVAYWVTPRAWDLVAGEKIVVKLADRFWAVKPYKGVAAEDFGKGGSTTKKAEVLANGYWGEMVLGHSRDASLYSSTYYDAATKTLTYTGPKTFTDDDNTQYPALEQTGTPAIVMAVSNVSHYVMRIVEPGPYYTGVTYTLEVTAKNYTDVTVTGWNGTVDLAVPGGGANLGAASLTYTPANGGVKTTTIEFTTVGSVTLSATDRGFPLDITDQLVIPTEIPEFPTLLIPVIGAVAVFIVLRRRDKKKKA